MCCGRWYIYSSIVQVDENLRRLQKLSSNIFFFKSKIKLLHRHRTSCIRLCNMYKFYISNRSLEISHS